MSKISLITVFQKVENNFQLRVQAIIEPGTMYIQQTKINIYFFNIYDNYFP